MNYSWYIGQKVVCVTPVHPLVKGGTYTVQAVCLCGCGTTALALVELPAPYASYRGCPECGTKHPTTYYSSARAWRFRPLDALTETMERIEKEGCPIEQQEPQLI